MEERGASAGGLGVVSICGGGSGGVHMLVNGGGLLVEMKALMCGSE